MSDLTFTGTLIMEALKYQDGTMTTTDYTGNLVLENGTRSRLLFDGGYVSMSNSGYLFFITDHLGSVRVVANTGGTAEEYNHYYPFGGPIAQYSSSTSLQPIKYQGKEWGADKGLQLYDFGARRPDVLALEAHRQAVVFFTVITRISAILLR